jgi:anti-anti-sigma factor
MGGAVQSIDAGFARPGALRRGTDPGKIFAVSISCCIVWLMAVSNNPTDTILLGRDDRGYFMAARGAVRASLCFPLREALLARLEGAEKVPAVYVDLSQCTYMDSTFIGLLVALDKRLLKNSGGRLHVLNPTQQCREILRQIGLETFLLVEKGPFDAPHEMREISGAPGRPEAEFILGAHEALMDVSEEAREKFKLLKEMLEKKLKSQKPPRDNP